MEILLIKALQLILSISLLVILHEGGHFLFAKLFGIRVHRFCLFFDFWKGEKRKALPLGKWGGTDFAIGWLPLGGYVEIAGMVDESTDAEAVAKEEATLPANQLFKNKPAWQRLLVMVGGVLVNFLVALFIYSMVMLAWGEERLPVRNITHGFAFSPTAEQMGFRDGDIIVGADDKTYTYFNNADMLRDLDKAKTIHVLRGDQPVEISLGNIELLKMLKEQPPFVALTIPSFVDSVLNDGPASAAGMRSGDRIVSLNGKPLTTWNEIDERLAVIQDQIIAADGKVDPKVLRTQIVVQHKNSPALDTLNFSLTAEGKLGVIKHNVAATYQMETIKHTLASCFPAGISHGWNVLSGYVSDLRYLFSFEGAKSVGSFGTIGSLFPAIWDWAAFWQLTAFISLMLAFMNFLPIPMLDGGYIFITLVEIITRRKLSDKWVERVNTVGFYFVLGLMALGIFNDVVRFVF